MKILFKHLKKKGKELNSRYNILEYVCTTPFGEIYKVADNTLGFSLFGLCCNNNDAYDDFSSRIDIRDIVDTSEGKYILFDLNKESVEYVSSISIRTGFHLFRSQTTIIVLFSTFLLSVSVIVGTVISHKRVVETPPETESAAGNISTQDSTINNESDVTVSEQNEHTSFGFTDYDTGMFYELYLESDAYSTDTDISSDAAIIEARLNQTFGDDRIQIYNDDCYIHILFPKDLLSNEYLFNYIFKYYISSQGIKYVTNSYSDENNYHTDKRMISPEDYTVTVGQGVIPGFDIEEYYASRKSTHPDPQLTSTDNYQYIQVSFTDEFIEANSSDEGSYFSKNRENAFRINQYVRNGMNCLFNAFAAEDEGSYYLYIDSFYYQASKSDTEFGLNAVEALFETPALSCEYSYNQKENSINWYDENNAVKYGVNQCPVSDMPDDYVLVYYDLSGADTYGDLIDVYNVFTSRLDTLQVPYSMGELETENNSALYTVVAIGYKNFGIPIANIINSGSKNVYVKNGIDILPSDFNVDFRTTEKNSLSVSFPPESNSVVNNYLSEHKDACNPDLEINNIPVFKCSSVPDGSVDVFEFDTVVYEGEYNKECIFNLANEIINGLQFPFQPELSKIEHVGSAMHTKDNNNLFEVVQTPLPQDCLDLFYELCPDGYIEYSADSTNGDNNTTTASIDLFMNMEVNGSLPGKALDAIRRIYELSCFESDNQYNCINFHICNDDITELEYSDISFVKIYDKIDRGLTYEDYREEFYHLDFRGVNYILFEDTPFSSSVQVYGMICNGKLLPYIEDFKTQIENNDFIQSFDPEEDHFYYNFNDYKEVFFLTNYPGLL